MQDTNISWLDFQTSFYKSHLDKKGDPATFRQILFSRFADHLPAIIQLRSIDSTSTQYECRKREIKNSLPCYSLNLLEERKKVLSCSGLIQFDFDKITDYDIEELKAAIFDLPFICFCGLSCSGKGLYAFAKIAEPDRLNEYAEHIFQVFNFYQVPIDTSKGRNANDLRYVSYDANMLYREYPESLKIKAFHKPFQNRSGNYLKSPDKLIAWGTNEIQSAQKGNRFETIRKVAYTLGGTLNGLDEIKNSILQGRQYAGEENEFLKIADKCFKEGSLKPISQ